MIKLVVVVVLIIVMLILMYCFETISLKQKLKNNNEHGSARWATTKEIKNNFRKENLSNINNVGFPIYFDKKLHNVWFDDETPHWCYLGSSGSGKSSTSVIPLCSFLANAKTKRSVFITDPKAEIFSKTSKMFYDNGYDVLTIDFRQPEKSKKINLLEPCILEFDKYIEHEENAKQLGIKKSFIEYRKQIVDTERDYIKNNLKDIKKIDSRFKQNVYLSYLENNDSILTDLLEDLSTKQID